MTASTLPHPTVDVPCAAGVLRPLAGFVERQMSAAGLNQYNMLEARAYSTDNGLTVIVGRDTTHHGSLLHVSISRRDRYPTWGEIKAVREVFYSPDIDVMMVMPKRADYVNLHKNCFHLWQTPTPWDIR